jgi:hypothetical protein
VHSPSSSLFLISTKETYSSKKWSAGEKNKNRCKKNDLHVASEGRKTEVGGRSREQKAKENRCVLMN